MKKDYIITVTHDNNISKSEDMKDLILLKEGNPIINLKIFSKKSVLLLVSILFISISSFAQHDTSHEHSESSNIEDERIQKLIDNLVPTIYIKDGQIINTTGDVPVKIELLDTQSYDLLYADNNLYDKVEVIKLRINNESELNNNLDISRLSGFNNLTHIYIICSFEHSDGNIADFIINNNDQVSIMHETYFPG